MCFTGPNFVNRDIRTVTWVLNGDGEVWRDNRRNVGLFDLCWTPSNKPSESIGHLLWNTKTCYDFTTDMDSMFTDLLLYSHTSSLQLSRVYQLTAVYSGTGWFFAGTAGMGVISVPILFSLLMATHRDLSFVYHQSTSAEVYILWVRPFRLVKCLFKLLLTVQDLNLFR